eukprot:3528045-Amphidinium_carterae.1
MIRSVTSIIYSTCKAFESHGIRSCESIKDENFRSCVCKGAQSLLSSTGAIPSSLNAEVVFLGHNLLGGPIPRRLLGGSEKAQKLVAAKALECTMRSKNKE